MSEIVKKGATSPMQADAVITALTKAFGGKNYRPSPVSLEIDPTMDFDEWKVLGFGLRSRERMIKWLIADWLVWGEERFPGEVSQVEDDLGYDYQTIANLKWVARSVPVSRRRENLSFSIHQEVARLDPDGQDHWLDKVEKEDWTRDRLRQEMAGKGLVKDIRAFSIGALLVKVEDGRVIVALECKGVWRDVVAVDLENLQGGREKIVQVRAISERFKQ